MATNLTIPVKPKKSVLAGKVPLPSDLEAGEICVNFADKTIYGKSPSGSVLQLAATSGQGAKADTALQPSALAPYRTSTEQDNLSIALSIAL